MPIHFKITLSIRLFSENSSEGGNGMLSVQTNIAAGNANRQLGITTKKLQN